MKYLSVCLLAALAAGIATPAGAEAPLAYEPFAAYKIDQNLAAGDQTAPPAGTGLSGYTAGNTILVNHARADSLAFGSLATSGGKLESDAGGVSLFAQIRTDATSPFTEFLADDMVGRQGTTLYWSCLFQLKQTSTEADQNYFAIRGNGRARVTIGQTWNSPRFVANGRLNHPIDTQSHLFVGRFDFKDGDDSLRIWFDPEPGESGESQPPDRIDNGAMDFNELEFKSQGSGFFLDEIRWGTSWEAVTPSVSTYSLTVEAGDHGEVFFSPRQEQYTQGQSVYLEATGAFGYKFSRWRGDVPAGRESENPMRLVIDRNHAITAEFEPGIPEFFNVEPTEDPNSSADPVLDLRELNETVAGENGWVGRRGDKLYLGDGTPVRFWGATTGVPDHDADLERLARFLARRGVNMVRWHTSVYNNQAPNFADVRRRPIDELHRLVAAMKAQGIYSKISFFFILGLRIQPEWDVAGYTQSWLTAHPEEAQTAPFGLQFFDPTFQAAYRNWIREVLTTPNPYDPQRRPLAQDPAAAVVEMQNEDNLFFWTFDPERYPEVQRNRLESRFADWARNKYGSLEAAKATWGPGLDARDNLEAGRLTLTGAWEMTRNFGGVPRRMADQIAFLRRLQKDWYVAMAKFIHDDLGYPGLLTASNWHTADDPVLLDAEWETYTAADIIDQHNYFSAVVVDRAVGTRVSGGDTYFGIPAINNPRRFPLATKQVAGFPTMISESTWTLPTDFKPEAALLVGSYGAMADVDFFFWFATGEPGWLPGNGPWVLNSPALAGLWPAAALIYRRGYVREAPVVVREARSLDSIYRKEPALVSQTFGWDPTRDLNQEFNYNPETQQGRVDSLATLVGKVEVAYEEGPDFVAPELTSHIDASRGIVRSITGELEIRSGEIEGADPDHPRRGGGTFRIDSPYAQGAAGYLEKAGLLEFPNFSAHLKNRFASVVAVALDGMPLRQSQKILIQAGAREQMRMEQTRDTLVRWNNKSYVGKTLEPVGQLPWQMQSIDGVVALRDIGPVETIHVVDPAGYIVTEINNHEKSPLGCQFRLPAQALYTVVTLGPHQFARWEAFTPDELEDPKISGAFVDYDGDGMKNFLEYMLGLNPKTPDDGLGGPKPDIIAVEPDIPESRVEFSFNIRTGDPHATHSLRVSNDLESWGDADNALTKLGEEPMGNGFTRYTYRTADPLARGDTLFVQLVVSE